MMTARKLALLQVAKMHLGLEEDDYRDLLERLGGCRSARDLNDRGFDVVMDHFRSRGFVSTERKTLPPSRYGMATPPQIAKIKSLWGQWAEDRPSAQLGAFLERTCKVSSLNFLTRPKAGTAITALYAMLDRRERHDR